MALRGHPRDVTKRFGPEFLDAPDFPAPEATHAFSRGYWAKRPLVVGFASVLWVRADPAAVLLTSPYSGLANLLPMALSVAWTTASAEGTNS